MIPEYTEGSVLYVEVFHGFDVAVVSDRLQNCRGGGEAVNLVDTDFSVEM